MIVCPDCVTGVIVRSQVWNDRFAYYLLVSLMWDQLLGLHHVHPGAGQTAWDIGFLLSGVLLVGGGTMLVRRARLDGLLVNRTGSHTPREGH